jgi:catechol 2,3-dioxygenase-like lactoylglutathione lyase family enzyme
MVAASEPREQMSVHLHVGMSAVTIPVRNATRRMSPCAPAAPDSLNPSGRLGQEIRAFFGDPDGHLVEITQALSR